MRAFHCTCALLLALAASASAQQAPPASAAADTRAYLVFLGGTPIGREELTVREDATGWTLTGRGSLAAPANLTTRTAEIRYTRDWTPESFALDVTANNNLIQYRTTFANGVATSQGTDTGQPVPATQTVTGPTFVLPNSLLTANEALGRWLATGPDTTGELHAFVAPGVDILFRVVANATERMQSGTTSFEIRTYDLRFANPAGETALTLTTTAAGALVRLSLPAQGVDVVRADLASPTTRRQTYSHPGDEAVLIPGTGFNIGATLTRPRGASLPPRLPAVVLLAGSGANERDGAALGIPIIGQLAGALADAGFLAVRYDKRGYGQSGGRAESATLSDYADDARTVVTWLRRRTDVDPDRVAVIGHSEGAWVALLAAARERRIAAVGVIAAPSVAGGELVLEQQAHALELAGAPPAEREQKVALQKKIHDAVLAGRGWEEIPPELRRQADTPWFQSLLAFEPAEVIEDVRQPILLVHGQLDRQVPVSHADRLAAMARTEGRSKSVELVTVRGVNHLLVPATTGEVAEYRTLTDRQVTPEVTGSIATWLTRVFAARQ